MQPPQLDDLAWAFQVGALVLGVPAVVVLALYGLVRLRVRRPAVRPSDQLPKNPDVVLLLLGGMTKVFETAAAVLGGLGKLLLRGSAVIALVTLPLALLLAFTAHGIRLHESWARFVAGGISGGALLLGLLGFVAVRSAIRLSFAAVAAVSAYFVWAAWNGYAP